jgi:TPR repeat protein
MNNFGVRVLNGKEISPNLSKAAKWFQRAAELSQIDDVFEFGICLLKGAEIEQNLSKAAEWFQRAANLSHINAMFDFGIQLHSRIEIKRNLTESLQWFQKQQKLATLVPWVIMEYADKWNWNQKNDQNQLAGVNEQTNKEI